MVESSSGRIDIDRTRDNENSASQSIFGRMAEMQRVFKMRYNPFRQYVGAFIPNWLLERTEISSHAKLVFARLAQFAGRGGESFPYQKTLCEEIGLADSTMRKALAELVKFRILESVQNGLGRPNSYFFLRHEWMKDASSLLTGEQPSLLTGEQVDCSPVSKLHKVEENQLRESSDDAFKAFWKAYPRKENKGGAEKAWKKIKPDQIPLIMAAIEIHKRLDKWKEDSGTFIPHPASWLNGKRWEDDIIGVAKKIIIGSSPCLPKPEHCLPFEGEK